MFDEVSWAVTHVLRSPVRLKFLFSNGGRTFWNLSRFMRHVVPQAGRELREIQRLAAIIPDGRLRHEAQASSSSKAYHVLGGCILATFLPRAAAGHYIEIIAPLESIYDYLDNLCDRHPEVAPQAYPVLHQAIADALDPNAKPRSYYERGPSGDDGGYLTSLVQRSQAGLRRLADHELLLPYFREAAGFYTELQSYKHLPPGERERACIAWYERNRERFADLEWFEFACAAGSQFQVYGPLYALFAGNEEAIDATYRAYFPPLAALHVLLDSYIDQAEDREHSELNFIDCYTSESAMLARLTYLATEFQRATATLPERGEHRFVLRAMALFYLTHPKIAAQHLEAGAARCLHALDVR
jgi:tetraprenyl-beta-curcumene synthase